MSPDAPTRLLLPRPLAAAKSWARRRIAAAQQQTLAGSAASEARQCRRDGGVPREELRGQRSFCAVRASRDGVGLPRAHRPWFAWSRESKGGGPSGSLRLQSRAPEAGAIGVGAPIAPADSAGPIAAYIQPMNTSGGSRLNSFVSWLLFSLGSGFRDRSNVYSVPQVLHSQTPPPMATALVPVSARRFSETQVGQGGLCGAGLAGWVTTSGCEYAMFGRSESG